MGITKILAKKEPHLTAAFSLGIFFSKNQLPHHPL
ncbi:hypothetical protein VAA_00598 [Vibrio anguillarum 775]|nr:hypothetical protein VAA_00598 [Vibrio anguillarum 775]